jgi:glycogen operon protein
VHGVSDLAYRLTGSSDLYQSDGRSPWSSINFVTAHDGFTLRDLVSYDGKHNDANGEENRDGTDDNRSWNCGVEGDTDDQEVLALRARQQRNFLATLLLSQGCPMLLHGDEIGRTQGGNNNAYCQDNEISWIDWEHADRTLLAFTRRLIALRREQPVLRRRRFFAGQIGRGPRRKDIAWFRQDGQEMREADWRSGSRRSLGMLLNGDLIPDRGRRGEPVEGDTLLILFHSHEDDLEWTVPVGWGDRWEVILDSALPAEKPGTRDYAAGAVVHLVGRSVLVLRRR